MFMKEVTFIVLFTSFLQCFAKYLSYLVLPVANNYFLFEHKQK